MKLGIVGDSRFDQNELGGLLNPSLEQGSDLYDELVEKIIDIAKDLTPGTETEQTVEFIEETRGLFSQPTTCRKIVDTLIAIIVKQFPSKSKIFTEIAEMPFQTLLNEIQVSKSGINILHFVCYQVITDDFASQDDAIDSLAYYLWQYAITGLGQVIQSIRGNLIPVGYNEQLCSAEYQFFYQQWKQSEETLNQIASNFVAQKNPLAAFSNNIEHSVKENLVYYYLTNVELRLLLTVNLFETEQHEQADTLKNEVLRDLAFIECSIDEFLSLSRENSELNKENLLFLKGAIQKHLFKGYPRGTPFATMHALVQDFRPRFYELILDFQTNTDFNEMGEVIIPYESAELLNNLEARIKAFESLSTKNSIIDEYYNELKLALETLLRPIASIPTIQTHYLKLARQIFGLWEHSSLLGSSNSLFQKRLIENFGLLEKSTHSELFNRVLDEAGDHSLRDKTWFATLQYSMQLDSIKSISLINEIVKELQDQSHYDFSLSSPKNLSVIKGRLSYSREISLVISKFVYNGKYQQDLLLILKRRINLIDFSFFLLESYCINDQRISKNLLNHLWLDASTLLIVLKSLTEQNDSPVIDKAFFYFQQLVQVKNIIDEIKDHYRGSITSALENNQLEPGFKDLKIILHTFFLVPFCLYKFLADYTPCDTEILSQLKSQAVKATDYLNIHARKIQKFCDFSKGEILKLSKKNLEVFRALSVKELATIQKLYLSIISKTHELSSIAVKITSELKKKSDNSLSNEESIYESNLEKDLMLKVEVGKKTINPTATDTIAQYDEIVILFKRFEHCQLNKKMGNNLGLMFKLCLSFRTHLKQLPPTFYRNLAIELFDNFTRGVGLIYHTMNKSPIDHSLLDSFNYFELQFLPKVSAPKIPKSSSIKSRTKPKPKAQPQHKLLQPRTVKPLNDIDQLVEKTQALTIASTTTSPVRLDTVTKKESTMPPAPLRVDSSSEKTKRQPKKTEAHPSIAQQQWEKGFYTKRQAKKEKQEAERKAKIEEEQRNLAKKQQYQLLREKERIQNREKLQKELELKKKRKRIAAEKELQEKLLTLKKEEIEPIDGIQPQYLETSDTLAIPEFLSKKTYYSGMKISFPSPPHFRAEKVYEWISYLRVESFTAGKVFYPMGGIVRDALLGIVPNDVDCITNNLQLLKQLVQKGSCYENRRRIGLYTIGGCIDIIYIDEKNEMVIERAIKDFTDITINQFFLDENDQVLDPCGKLEDLKKKHLVLIGNLQETIGRDLVRILRACGISTHTNKIILEEDLKILQSFFPKILTLPFGVYLKHLSKIFLRGQGVANFHNSCSIGLLPYLIPNYMPPEYLQMIVPVNIANFIILHLNKMDLKHQYERRHPKVKQVYLPGQREYKYSSYDIISLLLLIKIFPEGICVENIKFPEVNKIVENFCADYPNPDGHQRTEIALKKVLYNYCSLFFVYCEKQAKMRESTLLPNLEWISTSGAPEEALLMTQPTPLIFSSNLPNTASPAILDQTQDSSSRGLSYKAT